MKVEAADGEERAKNVLQRAGGRRRKRAWRERCGLRDEKERGKDNEKMQIKSWEANGQLKGEHLLSYDSLLFSSRLALRRWRVSIPPPFCADTCFFPLGGLLQRQYQDECQHARARPCSHLRRINQQGGACFVVLESVLA